MRRGGSILRRAAGSLPGTECAPSARGAGRGAGENGREAGAAVGGRGVHAGDGPRGGIAGPAVTQAIPGAGLVPWITPGSPLDHPLARVIVPVDGKDLPRT